MQLDNDELLEETPPDVILILGFDPLELFEKCPKCGKILIEDGSGIWCVNPNCEVTDDCYMTEGERNE